MSEHPSKKSKKERSHLIFKVKNEVFMIERKFIPEASVLKVMIDDPDHDTIPPFKGEEENIFDVDLLNVLIQDIQGKNKMFECNKIILTCSKYNRLLYMVNYFHFTYDHTKRFDLHWFHKYTFNFNSQSKSECCYIQNVCIFDLDNSKVSVHMEYMYNKILMTVVGCFIYRVLNNGVCIHLKKNSNNELIEYIWVQKDVAGTIIVFYVNLDSSCSKHNTTFESKIYFEIKCGINMNSLFERNLDWTSDPCKILFTY